MKIPTYYQDVDGSRQHMVFEHAAMLAFSRGIELVDLRGIKVFMRADTPKKSYWTVTPWGSATRHETSDAAMQHAWEPHAAGMPDVTSFIASVCQKDQIIQVFLADYELVTYDVLPSAIKEFKVALKMLKQEEKKNPYLYTHGGGNIFTERLSISKQKMAYYTHLEKAMQTVVKFGTPKHDHVFAEAIRGFTQKFDAAPLMETGSLLGA